MTTGVRRRAPRVGGATGGAKPSRQAALVLALLVIAATVSSCAVRLVSQYDEHFDLRATSLQQEMDAHLTRLEELGRGAEADYEANAPFYMHYGVELRSMRIRAQGHERNEITIQQLDRIESSLGELRGQHERSRILPPDYITTARELFNTAWGAVIAWELAKKRGGGR